MPTWSGQCNWHSLLPFRTKIKILSFARPQYSKQINFDGLNHADVPACSGPFCRAYQKAKSTFYGYHSCEFSRADSNFLGYKSSAGIGFELFILTGKRHANFWPVLTARNKQKLLSSSGHLTSRAAGQPATGRRFGFRGACHEPIVGMRPHGVPSTVVSGSWWRYRGAGGDGGKPAEAATCWSWLVGLSVWEPSREMQTRRISPAQSIIEFVFMSRPF